MKRVSFFTLFISVFVGLHLWAGHVIFGSLPLPEKTFWWLFSSAGLALSFSAILFDLPKWHRGLFFLDWIGYCWIGVFGWAVTAAAVISILDFFFPDLLAIAPYLPLILVSGISAVAIYLGSRFPRVVRFSRVFDFSSELIARPLRIVHLSDVHIGMLHLRGQWLRRVVDEVNAENPDVVVITGDLIESDLAEISEEMQALRWVRAPHGRFYVTGNHEYFYGGTLWEKKLEALGWTPLHSECKVFQFDRLSVQMAGVPDRVGKVTDTEVRLDYERAMSLPESHSNRGVDLRILLVHQPSEIRRMGSVEPHLILTGHTHGGQIFPFRPFVRMVQPVVSGWKQFGNAWLFVHQGTGFWGPPMRLGSRSEIVVIDIRGR